MDSASALAELKSFQGTRKSAGSLYDEASKELGVGDTRARANDMRGLIRNTETALKGVNDSVAGRTRGQLVTEAQRSRLANLERAPIAEELSGLQGGYADEMANYRDLLGQAGTKSQLAYQSDSDRLAALEGNYNKLFAAEQAAAAQRQWEAQQAEQRRQFEAQLAESRRQSAANAAASRAGLASLANLQGASTGGGGTTLRNTWQKQAAKGDWNAQVALNYAGDDGRFDGAVNTPEEYNILRKMGIQGNYYVRGTMTGGALNKGFSF